ncbi:MAG: hypothetical protein JNL18_10330 [Planctomycetaceae bacterium]|uniref:Uncharacterized protein n=1 Tax=Lacipirellula limnantheis TaxID=2528024 RepID=A0A517TV16_9BACT|nr:hypothetical protein [Lacipirellula limnantheis]MBL9163120.1 hypothetical protein [Planctomycetaceae bacterium]QDT72220.1 hypothetical protein I41_13900 [Lacipirellula limnantheis]
MHELNEFARHIVDLQLAGDLPNDISKVATIEVRNLYAFYIAPGRDGRDWPETPWAICTDDEFEEGFFEAYDYRVTNFACPGIVVPEEVGDYDDATPPEAGLTELDLIPADRSILSVTSFDHPLSMKEIAKHIEIANAGDPNVELCEYDNVRRRLMKSKPLVANGFIKGNKGSGYYRVK